MLLTTTFAEVYLPFIGEPSSWTAPPTALTDKFRQYDSPEDSIRGYGSFLKANSRYKHFLQAGAENEDAQLSALQSSGYATDPKYAFKLKSIINSLPDEEDEI